MTVIPDYSDLSYSLAGVRRSNPFEAKRSFAMKLGQQGADASPVSHPLQGAARLAQALAGAYGMYKADTDEKQAAADYEGKVKEASSISDPAQRMAALSALGGDAGLRATIASTGQELAKKRQRDEDMQASSFLLGGGSGPQQAGGAANAIAGIESGGRYDAIGPDTGGGNRAHGKYQVMASNVGPWTKEILGKEMTPQEFLANPQAQDAVFNAKFNQYRQQYGSDEAAARAWFAGPGGMNNPNAADVNGMTVARYGQKFQAGMNGQGGPQQAVLRGPPGTPTPIGTYTPGTAQVELAQGSADGSGTPLPPARQGPDPGSQYEDAARRAHAAGRGDLTIKFMQQATAAREAAAKSDAGRSLVPREEGPDLVWYDSRTGQPVSRVSGGAKKAPGESGAIPGQGIENQARNALVRAANDPAYRASPDYASLYGNLKRPRIDPATGMQIPPEDLSAFPEPTYRFQGQPQAPQQAAAPPPGAPPAPSPSVVGGPAVVAQPPQPGGIVATPVQGMPPKPTPEAFKRVETDVRTVAAAIDNFQKIITDQGGGSWDALINNPRSPQAQKVLGAFETMKTALRSEAFINTGVLQPAEMKMLDDMLLSPGSVRGSMATPDAYKAKLDQFRTFIDNKLAAAHQAHGLPPPTQRFSTPPAATSSRFTGPDGRQITMQEIEETARNRGISADDVISRLKLRPVQ